LAFDYPIPKIVASYPYPEYEMTIYQTIETIASSSIFF